MYVDYTNSIDNRKSFVLSAVRRERASLEEKKGLAEIQFKEDCNTLSASLRNYLTSKIRNVLNRTGEVYLT